MYRDFSLDIGVKLLFSVIIGFGANSFNSCVEFKVSPEVSEVVRRKRDIGRHAIDLIRYDVFMLRNVCLMSVACGISVPGHVACGTYMYQCSHFAVKGLGECLPGKLHDWWWRLLGIYGVLRQWPAGFSSVSHCLLSPSLLCQDIFAATWSFHPLSI